MKKGFTLVELLAVIVVLSVLSTIGIVVLNNTQKSSKEKLYEEQINTLESTTKQFITENEGKTFGSIKINIFKENNVFNIPISLLLSENYITAQPINVTCGKNINGYFEIKVTDSTSGKYTITYMMSNEEETFCK